MSDSYIIEVSSQAAGIVVRDRLGYRFFAAAQPFFRLDNSRNTDTGGIGLGLTIARDIMLSHGGSLMLETSPQGGLRARCVLPATDVGAVFES